MSPSLNLNTYFGSDDLRAYPESPEDIKTHIAQELTVIDSLTGSEKFKRLSRVGVKMGQVNQYSQAHVVFAQASEHFANTSPVMSMLNFIRWADIYRFEKRFEDSFVLLSKAEALLKEHGFTDYEDFFNQHSGKWHFDQGNFQQALIHFEKAHELRKLKNDPELLDSTELAIRAAQRRLK